MRQLQPSHLFRTREHTYLQNQAQHRKNWVLIQQFYAALSTCACHLPANRVLQQSSKCYSPTGLGLHIK